MVLNGESVCLLEIISESVRFPSFVIGKKVGHRSSGEEVHGGMDPSSQV